MPRRGRHFYDGNSVDYNAFCLQFVHIAYVTSLLSCVALGVAAQILPARGPWEALPLTIEGCSREQNATVSPNNTSTWNSTYPYSSNTWMDTATPHTALETPP